VFFPPPPTSSSTDSGPNPSSCHDLFLKQCWFRYTLCKTRADNSATSLEYCLSHCAWLPRAAAATFLSIQAQQSFSLGNRVRAGKPGDDVAERRPDLGFLHTVFVLCTVFVTCEITYQIPNHGQLQQWGQCLFSSLSFNSYNNHSNKCVGLQISINLGRLGSRGISSFFAESLLLSIYNLPIVCLF
jgi:hypothetical protein